jgi:hypothetical protein
MARAARIKLASPAWKTGAQSIYQARIEWRKAAGTISTGEPAERLAGVSRPRLVSLPW